MAPSGATPILLRRTTDCPQGPAPTEIAPQAWRGGSSRAFSAAIVMTEYGTHHLPVVESERGGVSSPRQVSCLVTALGSTPEENWKSTLPSTAVRRPRSRARVSGRSSLRSRFGCCDEQIAQLAEPGTRGVHSALAGRGQRPQRFPLTARTRLRRPGLAEHAARSGPTTKNAQGGGPRSASRLPRAGRVPRSMRETHIASPVRRRCRCCPASAELGRPKGVRHVQDQSSGQRTGPRRRRGRSRLLARDVAVRRRLLERRERGHDLGTQRRHRLQHRCEPWISQSV